MKLNVNQILQAIEPLKTLHDAKVTMVTAVLLAGNIRVLERVVNEYNSQRDKLVKEYGEKDEEKQTFNVPTDKLAEFNEKMSALLLEAVEVDVSLIDVASFGDDVKMTGSELFLLDWLLPDGTPPVDEIAEAV